VLLGRRLLLDLGPRDHEAHAEPAGQLDEDPDADEDVARP
jgi:hypothetical protein